MDHTIFHEWLIKHTNPGATGPVGFQGGDGPVGYTGVRTMPIPSQGAPWRKEEFNLNRKENIGYTGPQGAQGLNGKRGISVVTRSTFWTRN